MLFAVLTFFYQNQMYKELVKSVRREFPSFVRRDVEPLSLSVRVLEIEGEDRCIVEVLSGEWERRRLLLRIGDEDAPKNLTFFRCTVNKNQRQFLSPKGFGFDYDKYLYSRGITGVFTAKEIEPLEGVSPRLEIRRRIAERIESGGMNGMMNALVLGEKNEYEHYRLMKELGISHLLVISGLHFSIVHAFASRLFHVFGNKYLRFFSTVLLMGLMLLIVKQSYSAERAFYSLFYSEGCRLIGRKKDILTEVAFSLLMILIVHPYAVLSTGLYLSYYTYIAVVFVYPKIRKKSKYMMLELISFSVFIQFATLPIAAFLFGEINLYSFLANILCVPYLTLIVPLAFLVLILSKIPGAVFLWNLCAGGFEAVVLSSPIHSVSVTVEHFTPVVLAVFLMSSVYVFRNLHRKSRIVGVLALILCLIPVWKPDFSVVNFDVGHGDSTLLRFGGRSILIDTGDGRCKIAQELRSLGVTHLDCVLITHAHKDHVGGLKELTENMTIDLVILTENSLKVLASDLEKREMRIPSADVSLYRYRTGAGSSVLIAAVKNDVGLYLDPERKIHLELMRFYDEKDENDNGICVFFRYKEHDFVFFGDASDRKILSAWDQRFSCPVFFLKVPHHGSATSASEEIYRRIRPKYLSVSHSHKYALPSADFMNHVDLPYSSTYKIGAHMILPNGMIYSTLE